MAENKTLSSRREFLYLYDIKMGNPNGDPDENRPRVLPDGTHYVTDVRLKRFVRDYRKSQGDEILVDSIEGKTTNLTGRVANYLANNRTKLPTVGVAAGNEIVRILLDAFFDARCFGSSFAFKKKAKNDKTVKVTSEINGETVELEWEPPKTLTGAVQIQHGEVKHEAQEVDIHGTSVFGSAEEKTQGTFTTYFGLRYALIAFHGMANEHSAKLSQMTDHDYDTLLDAMWNGIRAVGNTRTKRGQVPRLLVSINYNPGVEFQFGNLMDYVALKAANGKTEKEWASPDDYKIDLTRLAKRIGQHSDKINSIDYCASPDVSFLPADVTSVWTNLNFDGVLQEA